MSETISGKIIDAGPEGLTIRAPYSDWQRFVLRNIEERTGAFMQTEATNPKAEPRDSRHGARHCPVAERVCIQGSRLS